MTTEVFRRLVPVSKVAGFAIAAIAFSLFVGVANAAQPAQGGDTYNYTRGGGG